MDQVIVAIVVIFATNFGSVIMDHGSRIHLTSSVAQDAGLPLWHTYMLLGMTVPLNKTSEHPQHAFMQTFDAMLAVMSRMESEYISERVLENQSNLTTLWHGTGPCGAGSYSSVKRERNFRKIMVTVSEIFYINVTVLWQKMTYVHPNCSTSYVDIIPGDFGTRYRKCGTGGKYFNLIKHYVAYINISYYEMKDDVSVAFIYQVITAEGTDNIYALPNFISLHVRHMATLLAAEALKYDLTQYFLWTFSTFHFLHYVVNSRIVYNCIQSLGRNGRVLLGVWDGDETGFITASGIQTELSVLQSVELCNNEERSVGYNGEIVATGSTGGITLGLEYELSARFWLRVQISSHDFRCTPNKCNFIYTSIVSNSIPSFFHTVLENMQHVYIHGFASADGELYPVLIVNNLTYERFIPVNTSACPLGLIQIYMPQQLLSMTFCSDIQLEFLKKTKSFGGIHFANKGVAIVIKNHGRFGKISLNYTLSLSPCVGINNLCQILLQRIPDTYGRVVFNGYSFTIEKEACVILHAIPSDGMNADNCTFIVRPKEPYYRTNVTIRSRETREEGKIHPACISSLIVSVDIWKRKKKHHILYSPSDYQNLTFRLTFRWCFKASALSVMR